MRTEEFGSLLKEFAAACCVNDAARFTALFTENGTYEDDFFGLFRGRAAIAQMLQRFHDTGENYRWEFHDALSDRSQGYASFRFSFS